MFRHKMIMDYLKEDQSVSKSIIDQLDYVFNPSSVAVIGASNRVGTWGFGVMTRLLSNSRREIYPVNPNSSEILGIKAYKNIGEIEKTVDFAVMAVPPEKTPSVMQECVDKGVKAALVISGGLSESGEEGAMIEDLLVDLARKGGIRFIGPNSMGHIDTSSHFSTLAWMEEVKPGPVAFLAQSGTYGQRVVRTGMQGGIGFSKFVSNGNEADLHLEDYIEYLAQDDDTKIITAYVEGIREGRRFYELAKTITKEKPIIIMKAGGTENSAKAARSHTSALSGSDLIHDVMFKQAGVIQVEDEDELFDVVLALLSVSLPKGENVGLLTEGGGIGVVAAEVCDKMGLHLPSYSTTTIETMRKLLPPRCSLGNPTDMTDVITAGKAVTFPCLWAIMEDPKIDAVMLLGGVGATAYFSALMGTDLMHKIPESDQERFKLMIDFLETEELKNLDITREKIKEMQKPLFFVNLIPRAVSEPESFNLLRERNIPIYSNPYRAAKVIKHLAWYYKYLNRYK